MIIGIEASNIREGGGTTHLRELLRAARPEAHGIDRVIVWAGRTTCARLPRRPWLRIEHEPALDGPLPVRLAWQRARLPTLARRHARLLFALGGNTSPDVSPRVVMSRNMLPFEPAERARYGLSWTRLRLWALRHEQARTFAAAEGVIFLTRYAFERIGATLASPPRRHAVIPHGVDERLRREPRPARALDACRRGEPFRVVYASTVAPYKHQHVVVEAARALRAEGLPLRVDFLGACDGGPYSREFLARLRAADPTGEHLVHRGWVDTEAMAALYARADACVFASSCENLPNILLESMASGLPIACSDRGPMPEVLADAGVYFSPDDPRDLARALKLLAESAPLRDDLASRAFERARGFTWERCADETFALLACVARES